MPNVTDIVIGLETFTSDYEGLLGSVTITGYATENPFVAEVGLLEYDALKRSKLEAGNITAG